MSLARSPAASASWQARRACSRALGMSPESIDISAASWCASAARASSGPASAIACWHSSRARAAACSPMRASCSRTPARVGPGGRLAARSGSRCRRAWAMSPRRTSYAAASQLALPYLVAHCRRRQAQRLLGQLGGRPDRSACRLPRAPPRSRASAASADGPSAPSARWRARSSPSTQVGQAHVQRAA